MSTKQRGAKLIDLHRKIFELPIGFNVHYLSEGNQMTSGWWLRKIEGHRGMTRPHRLMLAEQHRKQRNVRLEDSHRSLTGPTIAEFQKGIERQ
jgi:hypothetical protein